MPKRIIIAEDTPHLLEEVRESLQMEGYDVFTGANGEIALRLLRQNIPDLIITDLRMPVMDGFELIKRVRENPLWSRIPILVFTSMPMPEFEGKVLDIGATGFLGKPCSMEKLLEVVTKTLS